MLGQVRRSLKRNRQEGDRGLVHRLRGRCSNRRIDQETKQQALALIEEHYRDFGPTLASEYLAREHGLCFSVETVRNWMTEAKCGALRKTDTRG